MVIALMALGCTGVFWELFGVRSDWISRLSIATAYAAFFLLLAALVFGPWNVLSGKPNPLSFDLRRDVGIWAGILALAHTAIGLNVHLRGRPWLYFVDLHNRVRHDAFGLANDSGGVAAMLLLLLLAISNDLSLRRLGTKKWKSLQRYTYAAAGLTVIHGVTYQHVEKRHIAYEIALWGSAGLIAALQLAGWRAPRAQEARKRLKQLS